jgi:CBS domain-containing protein
MKVKEIMTTPVIVGKEENTLEEIANIILDNKYRLCSDCRKGWEDGRDNNRD